MKRVLITDDSFFMRNIIRKILEKNGYQIIGEAENGQEAVEQYEKLKPDIVTMDVTMPVMSGIDATKEIKFNHPKVKIVMVSAIGTNYKVMEALQAGADDFIVKPFHEQQVLSCLDKL